MSANMKFVGVLELASKYRYGLTSRGVPLYLFKPYDETCPDLIVGCSIKDITKNQIAIVVKEDHPHSKSGQKPRGMLLQLLGPVGDIAAERCGLLEHWCPYKPQTVVVAEEPEAKAKTADCQMLTLETGWTTFHVDPPGCRDIDDAIAWSSQQQRWAICIADAASLVPSQSITDQAARAIGQTFYDMRGRVVRSMLPPEISENTGSLLPHQEKPALAAFFSADGSECLGWALVCINVAHSFTYEEFTQAAANSLGLPATHLPVADSHQWIASWMVRYNIAAAKMLKNYGVGLLRHQSAADANAVAHWQSIHTDLGWMATEAATYKPAGRDDCGHWGLGVAAYTHASSPLRRYADLYNQRCLKACLAGQQKDINTDIDTLAEELNLRSRAERKWSRDLLFLENIKPGKVEICRGICVDPVERLVWIPVWRRLIRLRHASVDACSPGDSIEFKIFCDPVRRNWRERILTAAAATETEAKAVGSVRHFI